MKSCITLLAVVFVVAGGQAHAQMNAGNCSSCGQWNPHPGFAWRCEAGYHENNLWPAQYVPAARCAVNNAYTAMIRNGWRRQNLLGSHHFEEGSQQLSSAGKLKAKWILTQAPQDRRTVYIERGANEDITAARIAAVHSWAGNQSPTIEPGMVTDTHIVSEGHMAGTVDNIFVGFQANQRPPVLAPSTSGGSGGGGSAQ